MIESITLSSVATYTGPAESMADLLQVNFIYGSNGSGKTTISRVIADQSGHSSCTVRWRNGTALQAMVYNSDFVERNFNQSAELKGVFTLGEDQTETLKKVKAAKTELDTFNDKIQKLIQTLQGDDGSGGKKGELVALQNALREKCWAQKQKHDTKIQGGIEGYRNDKNKFKDKLLQEISTNKADLLPLEKLEKRCTSVFGKTPSSETTVPAVDATRLLAHEANPILKKRVIGKDDVDIAAMIKRLGNSDWVRQGRSYFEETDNVCPFCQQQTDAAFARSLEEYFDETFLTESKAIDDVANNYAADSERLQQQLSGIIAAPSRFIDVERLKLEKQLLDSKVTLNIQRLAAKKKEASQRVELESLSNVVEEIRSLLEAGNKQIDEHNAMVANLTLERKNLTSQVWKFLVEKLRIELDDFNRKCAGIEKAIENIDAQISAAKAGKAQKESEIRALEKQTTSVQPTVDAINALLSSFGFTGFSISKTASGTSYRLIRANGSEAKHTLSEGEKTFVTFLYFYHLLKGSDSESGMTTDRVVVIDDPVSSLDSDILFIVSGLIKGLFDEVRLGTGHIKQVFVLTHTVYFHKEITFNQKRKASALTDESFWVVRKADLVSKLNSGAEILTR